MESLWVLNTLSCSAISMGHLLLFTGSKCVSLFLAVSKSVSFFIYLIAKTVTLLCSWGSKSHDEKKKKMNIENHKALHFLMQLSLSNHAAEWYGERKSINLGEIFHWVRKGLEAGTERCVAGTGVEHLWRRANQLGSKVSKSGGSQRCARWDLETISQIISSPIISQILK